MTYYYCNWLVYNKIFTLNYEINAYSPLVYYFNRTLTDGEHLSYLFHEETGNKNSEQPASIQTESVSFIPIIL